MYCMAGDFDLDPLLVRPLRISWLTVGIVGGIRDEGLGFR